MSFFDIFRKQKKEAENLAPEENVNPEIKEEILRLMKNSIVMETDNRTEGLKPDASKIGGKPFLPADFIWPSFADKEDDAAHPLSFFCQLNLSELNSFDKDGLLPKKGILSFFYDCEAFCWGFDPEDKGAARVFYFEDTTDFVAADIPKALCEDYAIPEIAVKFKVEKSYPKFEEFGMHSNKECDWDSYDSVLASLGVDTDKDPEGHKILGYADVIQDEMLSECERVSRGMYCGNAESYRNTPEDEHADIIEKAKDWTLLLQLGTIEKEDFEWMFGDCGMLYYYIRKDDLAEKRFENMPFIVQCG